MILDFIQNFKLIIIPVVAFIFVQFLKIIITFIKGEFEWRVIGQYGGMPSAHAALVTGLVTEAWIIQGVNSLSFAISTVLAIIVLRDALGLRRYVGDQSKIINGLTSDIKNKKWPRLPEKVGHTWAQIGVGVVIGFFITVILLQILPPAQSILWTNCT